VTSAPLARHVTAAFFFIHFLPETTDDVGCFVPAPVLAVDASPACGVRHASIG
jgi:hypothetical protein